MGQGRKQIGKRIKRYSLKRLQREPLTIPTCDGAVTIGAEQQDGRMVARVELPRKLDTPPPK